jgi:hypothetical protein
MKPYPILAALALITGVHAVAQSFNFNTGTDAGLTRYNPLSGFQLGGTYSFPEGNSYRIQSASTGPFAGQLGPGRAGAFGSQTYSTFSVSVDLVNWNPALAQAFGPLARVQQPGLGTSDGYALLYFPAFQAVALNRIDNEAPFALPNGTVPGINLNPGLDYRMVFSGNGSSLQGQIFALTDLNNPLVTVSATDSTYASGVAGLLVAATALNPTSTGDATFDNLSLVPEPGEYALAAGTILAAFALWRRRPLA